jgi:hypothetical protein
MLEVQVRAEDLRKNRAELKEMTQVESIRKTHR